MRQELAGNRRLFPLVIGNRSNPQIRAKGGVMLMVDCNTEQGGMKINNSFIVNFENEPNGPARCHETRYPGGDCTSDIWV